MNQHNKAIEKVIKKKIRRIKDLENLYWKSINEQREKFATIDRELLNSFDSRFPSLHSSLIYGCIDGFVLIRHAAWSKHQTVNIEIINTRLSNLLKKLLIPVSENENINFSSFTNLSGRGGFGPGGEPHPIRFLTSIIQYGLHVSNTGSATGLGIFFFFVVLLVIFLRQQKWHALLYGALGAIGFIGWNIYVYHITSGNHNITDQAYFLGFGNGFLMHISTPASWFFPGKWGLSSLL